MAEGLSVPGRPAVAGAVDPEAGAADFDELQRRASEGVSGVAEDEPASPPKREQAEQRETSRPRRGRPPKAERARTRPAGPADAKPDPKGGKPEPRDFSKELDAAGDQVWLGLSVVPGMGAYAAVWQANQAGLVAAVNAGAQESPGLRARVEKLASGGGGLWMLQLAAVGTQMSLQAWELTRDADKRAKVAAANTAKLKETLRAAGVAVDEAPEAA